MTRTHNSEGCSTNPSQQELYEVPITSNIFHIDGDSSQKKMDNTITLNDNIGVSETIQNTLSYSSSLFETGTLMTSSPTANYLCSFNSDHKHPFKLRECPRRMFCAKCRVMLDIQKLLKKLIKKHKQSIIKGNMKINSENRIIKEPDRTELKFENNIVKYFWGKQKYTEYIDTTFKSNEQSFNLSYSRPFDAGIVKLYRCKYAKIEPYSCDSYIRITNNFSSYKKVESYIQHNHNFDIRMLSYPTEIKQELKRKMIEGVPIQRLYNDNLPNSTENMKKGNFISKNYLRVMNQKLGESIVSGDEYGEFLNFIIELKRNRDNIQLVDDDSIVGEKDNDNKPVFKFAFTTKQMIGNFEAYSVKDIFFDTTHSTNRYRFYLTTGLVINNCQLSVPFIYIISSTEKEIVFKGIFDNFKRELNIIRLPKYFMSDMALNIWNSWKDVFKGNTKQIWCYFHFIKAVKNKLNLYERNKIKRAKIENMIMNFKRLSNMKDFDKEYKKFMEFIKENNGRFYLYFMKRYDNNKEKWCLNYREGQLANTNNFCESFFDKLKRVYLKWNIRLNLQNLIIMCMKCASQIEITTQQSIISGKINGYRIKRTISNHKLAKKNTNSDSQTTDMRTFKYKNKLIILNEKSCEMGCLPMCKECGICCHMASCTCYHSYFKREVCWHIHKVFIQFRSLLELGSGYFLTYNDINEHKRKDVLGNSATDKINTRGLKSINPADDKFIKRTIISKLDGIKEKIEMIDEGPMLEELLGCVDLFENKTNKFLGMRLLKTSEIKDKRRLNIPQKKINPKLLEKISNDERINLHDFSSKVRGAKRGSRMAFCRICFNYNDPKLEGGISWIYCDLCNALYHLECAKEEFNIQSSNEFICCTDK